MPINTAVAATGSVSGDKESVSLVEKGLADLAEAVSDLMNLAAAGPDRWIEALESPEPDVQILAMRLIGQGKVSAALRAVSLLLKDPRERVAEAAAATLADIGDERAVPLLIGAIERGDLRSEVRVIEALGHIGGKESEAYLEMTARGHEVPEVRALSEHLLGRLRARKTQKKD